MSVNLAIDSGRMRATRVWRTLAAQGCMEKRTSAIVNMTGAHMDATLGRVMSNAVGQCSSVMAKEISGMVARITPRPLAHILVLSAPAWGLGAREWDR